VDTRRYEERLIPQGKSIPETTALYFDDLVHEDVLVDITKQGLGRELATK